MYLLQEYSIHSMKMTGSCRNTSRSQVMVSNIESIVERGERLDLIVDKAENLSNESVTFRQSGRRLQRRMWWQNARMKVRLNVYLLDKAI